jgi:hypothetical protein
MDLVLDEPAENDAKIKVGDLSFVVDPMGLLYVQQYGCRVDLWNLPHFEGFRVSLGAGGGC